MIKKIFKKKSPEHAAKLGSIEFIMTSDIDGSSWLEVKKAQDVIPEWYKQLPAYAKLRPHDNHEDLTIKRCVPVLDAFSSGYFLVTKEDYYFNSDIENEIYEFHGSEKLTDKVITMHPVAQLGNMPFAEEYIKYAYKWGNPYTIKTPPGYSIIFTHPFNWDSLPFRTMTGIVDTDTYFQEVLFPFFMKNNFIGKIPAGTPIVQIIPFKREDWSLSVEHSPSKIYMHKKGHIMHKYESSRYSSDGKPVGGTYKKIYRKKKNY